MESGRSGGAEANIKVEEPELDVVRHHRQFSSHARVVAVLFGSVVVTCLVLYHSPYPFQFSSESSSSGRLHRDSAAPATTNPPYSPGNKGVGKLKQVLMKAATSDKTVIITTLNAPWAAPNSVFDLFLESFQIGNETMTLLNHVVVVALDAKAYSRCLAIHPHCHALRTGDIDFSSGEAYFMTADYLKMMWMRIQFLHLVLKLGFNFIFTDADVMWFRNPMPHFHRDADFQIACDYFRGNPSDLGNQPNGGFNYVKSNNRTIEFYEFWYRSRRTYPGLHDQDVLNKIKSEAVLGTEKKKKIGLKMMFLDTSLFGGFCQPSRDLNRVCTMHANCCYGLESKVHDLKLMLQDWTKFLSLKPAQRASHPTSWSVPQSCSLEDFHPPDSSKKKVLQGSNS
ncbi:uncharacterized protein At4g15970-like [Diospyros lotus]|uniref:uncharacterized protein At4g15970-like n=1 Tax=Diospyros lotus TaxID=55363 RepID=UPI00224F7AA7|nr:uncharacterized protein At4g15970-like [Diospyros lotus]